MQAKLEKEFKRYFFLSSESRGQSLFSGFSMFSRGGSERGEVSEIIPQRVYLSNLPRKSPFSQQVKIADIPNGALVVSCNDFFELAESDLLLEPNSKNIKYHVVAMQDATAITGTPEHICDALRIMAKFAQEKKPIHIHCLSGVGRSPMMTALHIAHLYLLGDPQVKELLTSFVAQGKIELDPERDNFISELYTLSTRVVAKKRPCCQFNSREREQIAIEVLTQLHKEIKAGQLNPPHDINYEFINSLVQSASFKKLHYEYYNLLRNTYFPANQSSELEPTDYINLRKAIKRFFVDLIHNKEGWYQQLTNALDEGKLALNSPIEQFCTCLPRRDKIEQEKSISKRRVLLEDLITTLDQLSLDFPESEFSKQIIKYQEKQTTDSVDLNL